MKAKFWYILFPQDPYALGPVEFEKEVDEKTVRKWARDWDRVKRLPRHFQCWPTKKEA